MKKNMSDLDRAIRLLIAVVAVIFGLNEGGLTSLVLYIIAALLIYTAFTASCPVYKAMHMSGTKR
ncbi:MAG: YgaP family membrane protein [Sulfobacillus sp.]|jgi:uncharacterized membrane protein